MLASQRAAKHTAVLHALSSPRCCENQGPDGTGASTEKICSVFDIHQQASQLLPFARLACKISLTVR